MSTELLRLAFETVEIVEQQGAEIERLFKDRGRIDRHAQDIFEDLTKARKEIKSLERKLRVSEGKLTELLDCTQGVTK